MCSQTRTRHGFDLGYRGAEPTTYSEPAYLRFLLSTTTGSGTLNSYGTFGETRCSRQVIGRLPGETNCLTLVWGRAEPRLPRLGTA